MTPCDIPGLCNQVGRLLDDGVDLIVCDLSTVENADAVVVDAIARIQLVARRGGCQVRLDHASAGMDGLLVLAGLKDSVLFGR
jgi:hypothetical protein